MADINNNDIWIDVETLAKLKNITRRAVRLVLNQNKYEYKVENIRGGKTYKIKLSTLEEEFQLKYFQEYYDDYKTCDNEVIELSNLNIKQEKLISENQRKIALAKYDLIYAWLDFRKDFKRDKLKTGGNVPDKEFLQLYNTGMFQEEIFKILGKVSIGSLYRWRALLDYNKDWTALVGQYKYSTRKEYRTTLNEGTYLRVQRIGRGIRLDRKMRMQLWKVFEEYQNIMKESNLRDPNWAYYECKIAILNDKFSKNYKYIIVDEGQDLSMSAYLLLRAISGEEHENDIFIVGDAKQRIYKNKAILSKAGINIRGRSSKLRINYRTTEEIRKYATLVLENLTFDDLDGEEDSKKECQSLTHGVEPSVNYFQTANQELEFIVTKIMQLKAEGTEYKNICLTARTQKLLDDYSQYLLQHNIPYYEIKRSKIDDRSVDGIRIATMHRIKGLEFRYMFVAAVNKDIIPFKESQKHFDDDDWYNEYIKSEKCLLYVALTRAQRAVFITSYGKLSDLIKAS